MTIQEIIDKKRKKEELTTEEIAFFVNGYTKGEIKDYEAAALLMAIAINSMSTRETTDLTLAMAKSGEIVDLSKIEGIKADKHSTGGVSDTTTIAAVPILASLGIKMAKMSGRALGFTGGTIDKLEAIPNFNVNIEEKDFINSVNKVGACIIAQSKNIAPADKKLYALRDVTATVQSIPLIASSIMSKKIASGADIILLDVKYGNGAFMKTVSDAKKLAKTMIDIGKGLNKKMIAIITSMEQPLGFGIGCNMEIEDAVNVLKGAKNNLATVTKEICAQILMAGKNLTYKQATSQIEEVISNGKALVKLEEIVKNQGGDASVLKDFSLFKKAKYKEEIKSPKSGYITKIKSEELGEIVREIGGGRLELGQEIMHEVGIFMNASLGQKVDKNTTLCTLYSNKKFKGLTERIVNCFIISAKRAKVPALISAVLK